MSKSITEDARIIAAKVHEFVVRLTGERTHEIWIRTVPKTHPESGSEFAVLN
jgi:hypothetical protein